MGVCNEIDHWMLTLMSNVASAIAVGPSHWNTDDSYIICEDIGVVVQETL